MASAVVALAVVSPAQAQGKGKKSKPPSSSALPATTSGATPQAWIDDASLLAPGAVSVTISTMRWWGADLSEVDFPIVDGAIGLTPRVQIGASVPHIMGSTDGSGPVGGVGTLYLTGKIALFTGPSDLKLAVTPVVEVLGAGAAQGLAAGQSRMQFGLPVSMEIGQGPARVFASAGLFSRGARFVGGGAGFQATPRLALSVSFSRAWASTALTGVSRDRRELSGGATYFVRPQIGVFGSLGRTIATTDLNGAGTTISGGATFLLSKSIFN